MKIRMERLLRLVKVLWMRLAILLSVGGRELSGAEWQQGQSGSSMGKVEEVEGSIVQ